MEKNLHNKNINTHKNIFVMNINLKKSTLRSASLLVLLLIQQSQLVAQNSSTADSLIKSDSLKLGDTYGGGMIFYLDATGQHGLIAAPMDQKSNAQWGFFNEQVSAQALTIGSGLSNTRKIAKAGKKQKIAAVICYNLELNGFTDWYLPSKEELEAMYANLKLKHLGNFSSNDYWSSSETDFNNAWIVDFMRGFSIEKNVVTPACVRAIRSF